MEKLDLCATKTAHRRHPVYIQSKILSLIVRYCIVLQSLSLSLVYCHLSNKKQSLFFISVVESCCKYVLNIEYVNLIVQLIKMFSSHESSSFLVSDEWVEFKAFSLIPWLLDSAVVLDYHTAASCLLIWRS